MKGLTIGRGILAMLAGAASVMAVLPTAALAEGATGEPEVIEEAGDAAGLGFNNADQMAMTADGAVHAVWLDSGSVVYSTMGGTATRTLSTAGTRNSLAAITALGDHLVVAWTEMTGRATRLVWAPSTDAGATWSEPRVLAANGTAASLASSDGRVVAVWHEGSEQSATVWFARLDGDAWTTPASVSTSEKAALWAGVEIAGDDVWVVWRDNRDGAFSVWMRRSTDGGETWKREQQLVDTVSGDPAVCATGDGVYVAYHGRGTVSVIRSEDDGKHFDEPTVVGPGWFAHASCGTDGTVVIGWEHTTGSPRDDITKTSAYAVLDGDGRIVSEGTAGEAPAIAAAVLNRGDGTADILWIDASVKSDSGTKMPSGPLMHAVIVTGESR